MARSLLLILNTEWSARGELLVHVEADIPISDDGQELYSEILFPVPELASGLHDRMSAGSGRRGNFEFESMSFKEVGVVRIVEFDSGWRVKSIHQPGLWSKFHSLDDIDAEIYTRSEGGSGSDDRSRSFYAVRDEMTNRSKACLLVGLRYCAGKS